MIRPTFKMSRVVLRTAAVAKAVQLASIEPARKAALIVERNAKMSMRTGGGAAKTPSNAPNPPNVQTGALRASITHARVGFGYIVGPQEKYGKYHEFGTRNLPARPFIFPALLKSMREFPGLWRDLKFGGPVRGLARLT